MMNANMRSLFVDITHEIELYERDDAIMNNIKKLIDSLLKQCSDPDECEFFDKCGQSYAEMHNLANMGDYGPMRDESRE